jgi:predicted nucleic acid-binding protein
MMVVDTSAWIEWLTDSPIRVHLVEHFPTQENCVVPTIVQLELNKWLLRETNESIADQVIAFTLNCQVVALDTRIALLATDQHRTHKLATADAIVYATSIQSNAKLLTCDAHFQSLPNVIYIPK